MNNMVKGSYGNPPVYSEAEENKINKVEIVSRKSMKIRPSGRSTDFITPSFGYGCLFNCSYCYMKRNKPEGLNVADKFSTTDILSEINSHAWFATVDKPNQTHSSYITYDISCNEDFALHLKYHDWERIFDFFKDNERGLMASFATKYVNKKLLTYNPKGKVRIRFSLIPEKIRQIVEPNTSTIEERINAITPFIEGGYDVHVNFSPVIVYDGWLDDYRELFKQLDAGMKNVYKPYVKAEVIFLTHNQWKHTYNQLHEIPGEDLLWKPELQETKVSQYGGTNLRYKFEIKEKFVNYFRELHDEVIPWNKIRYIF